MSKKIDEKVVEMRFDNKQFEENVQTTLSTLDKLKAKLNLTGASKGLEEVNKASNKFNLDGMSNALETVSVKFSTLEFIGMTALANITNKAVNAGLALVKSLSIDQLTEGWKKYDQQTASVQTLVNSTGKSVKEIEKYLDKLMWYSDETSYGFTDMTSALATMTSSGGDIEKLIPMIEGVANATAFAGKGAAEFSRVMQFGINQAYALGYMQVQDWKTIEGATVNSKQLQESLISAAESLGKIKKGTVTIENFRASLKDKWLDQSVMELGFGQFSKVTEEIYEGVKSGAFANYADGLDKIGNKYGEVAQRAAASAQEAKTFQEAIIATKDAVSSQWMELWKSIFGNYDQAKVLWTDLANYLYDTFVQPLKSFKERVQAIMSFNPFQGIIDKIENSGIGKMAEKIDGLSKSLEYYQEMVNKVWRGDYKNQPYRKGLLEAEGHNFGVIQTLVNKGYQYKLTVDDVAAAEKEYGIVVEQTTEILEDLTDEKLKDAGLTEDEIKMYRELEKQSKKTGKSISDLVSEMETKTGRDLFIGAFYNFGEAISSILSSIGNAWRQAFPPKSELQIYRILEAFNKFSEVLKNRVLLLTQDADGELSAFTRTLRGLFSILHIITSFVGTGFKLAFKILEGVLSAFNISILDFTALIGDAIYKFDRWLTENNVFVESIKKITEWIVKSVIAIKDWIAQNEKIMDVINRIKDAFSNIGSSINTWIQGLKETENIPEYIFGGLVKGIQNEAPKVYDAIKEVANGIIETICKILKIHSPSKVMIAIGGFLILGIIQGLKDGSSSLFDFVGELCQSIIDIFKQIDLGDIVAVGISSGLIYVAKRMLDIADKLLAPIQGLTNIMNGLSSALSGVGAAAKDFGKSMKYQGVAAIIKSIAISIGVLAASLFVLAKLPREQLIQGSIALGAICLVLLGFILLLSKLSEKLSKIKLPDMGKTLAVVIGTAVGMLIMAKALKKVSSINPENMNSAIKGLIACAAAMAILVGTLALVANKLKGTKNIQKMGWIFLKIGISMLLIAMAIKMMSKMELKDLTNAGLVVGGLIVLLAAIGFLNKWTGNAIIKSAETIKALGVTLLLLAISMKLCGNLKPDDFYGALKVVGVFVALLTSIMLISKIFKGTEMIKVTSSIIMATVAVGLLAIIVKLMGNMDPEEMKKGIKCVSYLSAFVAALILVSKKSASLHGSTLIGVAMTIAAMGLMVFLLGQLDPEKAKNGIKAVGYISVFTAILLQAAKNFNPGAGAVKTLTALTTMLVMLSVALVGLSFLDQNKLMTTAGSLGAVMVALAAVIAATNRMKVGKGVFKSLALITLTLAALGAIVVLMSKFTNPEGAITSAVSLGIIATVCAGLMLALSKIKAKDSKNAMKGALALTAMAVPLLAFVGVLALMQTMNVNTSLQNIAALSILSGAMTALLVALMLIGKVGNVKDIAIGILGLTAMAVPLLAFVGVLALMQNVQNATENVKALVLLASALTLLLIPLTVIGAICATGYGAIAVAAGILALTAMAIPLLALVGVLALMQNIQNATQNVELLTTMMEKMTACLLALSLVAPLAILADVAIFGLIGAVTTMGVLATTIGALMDKFPKLQEFLDKGLPVLEQIALSIGKVIGNVVAGFMNSVAEELPHTGEKLSDFAVKALPFITIMSSVSNRMMEGTKAIAGSLLLLTGASLLDGIATFLSGGESFSRLGTELSKFAINALPFMTVLSGVSPSVFEGAKSLASAVLEFTKANFLDTITGWINGESDLGAFGAKLAPLGSGMNQFVNNLGTFSDDQVATVSSACDALKVIAEAAGEIPKHGGIVQAFTGDNDIEDFGKKLGPTGTSIKEFVTNLGTFSDSQVATVKSACDALKCIAEVAGEIPKHGGIKQAFTGDNDISEFAGKLGKVAEGIRGFVWELQKDNVIRDDSIAKINAVNNIMWAVADLGKINLGDTSGKLEELGARLGSFGNKITEYVKGINTVSLDDLESGKEKINKIIEIAGLISSTSSEAIEQLGERLKNFATDAINKFVTGLNDAQPQDDAKNAVKNIIDVMLKAMEDKKTDVENKVKYIIESGITALKEYNLSEVEESGKNFVQGFANGINNNLSIAKYAGSKVGEKALEGVRESTDTHSPSREAYKLGSFFDEGFINGVKSLQNKIYDESYGIGDKARLGLSRAIKGVSNLIMEGIDDEFSIRPVLDLSDIEAGAATINGMLGNPSLGVMTNLSAISSGMKAVQDNKNSNVISAIDKLAKNLGNTNGDTYNINGITYENGTEISDAVQTLVRAAKIGRRT